jgi:hypothetical protein
MYEYHVYRAEMVVVLGNTQDHDTLSKKKKYFFTVVEAFFRKKSKRPH